MPTFAPCSARDDGSAISSRWLTVCSMPEPGAVRPATPIDTPLSVSAAARSSSAAGSAAADAAAPRRPPRRRARGRGRRRPASRSRPDRRSRASSQSAGAVYVASRSPRPGLVERDGRAREDVRVDDEAVGPARRGRALHAVDEQDRLAVGEAVDARRGLHDDVCDAAHRALTALPMSATVPDPTLTIAARALRGGGGRVDRLGVRVRMEVLAADVDAPRAQRVGDGRLDVERAPVGEQDDVAALAPGPPARRRAATRGRPRRARRRPARAGAGRRRAAKRARSAATSRGRPRGPPLSRERRLGGVEQPPVARVGIGVDVGGRPGRGRRARARGAPWPRAAAARSREVALPRRRPASPRPRSSLRRPRPGGPGSRSRRP